MWLCTPVLVQPGLVLPAGCRAGWALLLLPAPILGVSTVLPFYRAVTSVISATANVTAAEGGIMDLGSVCNS